MRRIFSSFDFPASLIAGTATVAAIVICQTAAIAALSEEQIYQIAVPITVQVNPPDGVKDGGSGIIIKREGNTYTVLTCNHVLGMRHPLTIRTHDGQTHQVMSEQKLQKTPKDPDLALVTFNSSTNYPVAKLRNQEIGHMAKIYVMGFPGLDGNFGASRDSLMSPGSVVSRPTKAEEGYSLRYSAPTKGGMSGGPVFDADGRVVGVHGDGGGENIPVKEVGGSTIGSVAMKTGFSAAIPITTFLAMGSQIGESANNLAVDNTPSTADAQQQLTNPQTAAEFSAKGAIEVEEGNKSRAVESFTQAIKLDPNLADAYYRRANARFDLGDKKGALEDYDRALRLNPDYADAYYNRGLILYEQKNKLGALESFNQYIRRSPGDAAAYIERAGIRIDLGDVQGALEDFDQVVAIRPNAPRAYYNRGYIRYHLQDWQGAVEDFDTAIKFFRQQGFEQSDDKRFYDRAVALMQKIQGAGSISTPEPSQSEVNSPQPTSDVPAPEAPELPNRTETQQPQPADNSGW